MNYPKKLAVGICGASGVHLALRFIETLPQDIEVFVVPSEGALKVYEREISAFKSDCARSLEEAILGLKRANLTLLKSHALDSCISSGSFGLEALCIIPTSTDTLAKIAHGISDNLITRAASVMLKERKILLLAVREMPLNTIMLENMLSLSKLGAHIAPPIVGYYAQTADLDLMERFFIGKWFDLLHIPHTLFKRWE